MATWLYSKEFPKGKLFNDEDNLEELEADGWVDNPSKIVEEEDAQRDALLKEAKDLGILVSKDSTIEYILESIALAKSEPLGQPYDRVELLAKATELGLEFNKNIKTANLAKLIEEATKKKEE